MDLVVLYQHMDGLFSLFLLAVTQGVTEFLPISSSAHLVLLSEVFGGEQGTGITIVLHGATLVAVLCYFRRDLCRLLRALLSRRASKDREMVGAVILATLPVAVAGFFIYPMFSLLQTVPIVAGALVLSGSLLILADYSVQKKWVKMEIPLWRKGVGIGLMQVFALIPGVSRSGITIAGGRLLGFSRREAVRFSFLLAIPTIAGALVLLLAQTPLAAVSFDGIEGGMLALAAAVAGGVGYATIHLFVRLVERVGFLPFFCYQVALGATLLFLTVV